MAHYNAIFMSDIHLGTWACQATQATRFLTENSVDRLYLVGDIFDLWALKRRFYFPKAHQDFVHRVIEMSKEGTRVIYLTGNHDGAFRAFTPMYFDNIEIVDEAYHNTAGGQCLYIVHGDHFDEVMEKMPWLAMLGDLAYQVLLRTNGALNYFRSRMNLPYWSLSAYVKSRVKHAVNFIGSYEDHLVATAKEKNADGIIAGHIHHAEIKMIGDILYANCGDTVESGTAIVEDQNGHLSIALINN